MADAAQLQAALARPQSEARVQRMWRAIEAERAPKLQRARTGLASFALASSLGALAALVFFARMPVALTVAGSARMPRSFVAEASPRHVELSDGSTLDLAPGARLDLIETSDRAVALALRQGSVRFEVEPHGPRRWRIEAGAVQVEVVGTIFTVEREEGSTRVSVARGAVVVRGDGVADRVQRLGPGDSVVAATATSAALPAIAPVLAEAPIAAPSHEEPARRPEPTRARAASAPDPFHGAVEAHDFEAAYEALGPGGIGARSARVHAVDELFALADVARLSGHPAEAIVPLRRVVDDFPSDARAAVAAYTVARLLLDSLHRPAEAALAFERSLALGLPRSMRETASARRVEALGRARSPTVEQAAREHLAAYPGGRTRAEVERWLGR